MSDIIGLVLREDRLDGVVVRRQLRRAHALTTFSLAVGDQLEAALRAKLREAGVRTRRVHVGIPRRRAVVKVIELPTVAGADLRRMVGFELERHLPFPASEAVYDFHVVEQTPGQPVRVLLVAVERRAFERVAQLCREAGLVLRLVDVTIHSLAALAAPEARTGPGEDRVVLHLEETEAELAVVRHGRPLLSRAFALPPNGKERGHVLIEELRRSLGGLRVADREAVADMIVTGGALPETDLVDLPIHTAISLPPGVSGLPEDSPLVPALAVALRRTDRGALRTNLMPDELRPRPFPWPVALTAGLAGLTLCLALAVPALTMIRDERQLQTLNQAIERLAPTVREVEQLVSAVERTRREVETLRTFEAQHVRALPLLRELTELLPADVWLTNLSMDQKGIELAGFAASAAPLIPLLEASPTLERVEFTSPVTKGRDREQFRLKGTWERSPAASPPPASAEPVGPTRQPGVAPPGAPPPRAR